jgi:quercetin dioxygenase-like cupin family protein
VPDLEIIHSDDTVMTAPEPGLRRQVMAASDPMMLVRHRMEAGWVGAKHSHPHEQLIYIVSGQIALTVGDDRYDLRTGDSIIMPGGAEHQATAPIESEVLDVFTPAREDYR